MLETLKIYIVIASIILIVVITYSTWKQPKIESFQNKIALDDTVYIKKTMSYNKVWYNKNKNYTIWEPEPISDYYPLGHLITKGENPPKKSALLIKSNTNNKSDRPIRYDLVSYIILSANKNNIKKIGIWKPIPYKGYTCVGHVFQIGHQPPSVHLVRCVPSKITKLSAVDNIIVEEQPLISNLKGYNLWSIYDSNYFVGNDINNFKEPKERVYKIRSKFLNVEHKLPIKKTKSYQFIWKGYNHETKQNISIWRPNNFENYVSLGDIVYNSQNPNGILETILVDRSYVKPPENFGIRYVASFSKNNKIEVTFWKPKPPKGYGYLGYIATTTTQEPKDNQLMYCVPLEYLKLSESYNQRRLAWSTVQLSSQKMSIWRDNNSYFFVNKGYSKPSDIEFTLEDNFLEIEKDMLDIPKTVKLNYKLNSINGEIYDNDKRDLLYLNGLSNRLGIHKNRLGNLQFEEGKILKLDILSRPTGSQEHNVMSIINNMETQINNDTLKINNSNNDGHISKIKSMEILGTDDHVNTIPIDNSKFITHILSEDEL